MSANPDNAEYQSATGPPGHVLLDRLESAIARYVITPSADALVALVLWVAATHGQTAWHNATRVAIASPEKRCGKSRLLEVLLCVCHQPKLTSNVSTAALFRVIEMQKSPPTILIDEADTIFGSHVKAEQNEDLRGLINAGYSRHLPSIRCVGPQQIPKEFKNFAMLAAAGIGVLPDTITDRAVNIPMRRRMVGEVVAPFRMHRDGPPLKRLRDELSTWIGAHLDELLEADPETNLEDRAADNWAPLLAVADLAGGRWPDRARAASEVMTSEHEQLDAEGSLNVQLIRDIALLMKDRLEDFIGSKDLATQLRQDENLPWQELELTPRKLAWRLSKFDIRPKHNPIKTERGYRRTSFRDAINRYLPADWDKPEAES